MSKRGDEKIEERDGWEVWLYADTDAPDPRGWMAEESAKTAYPMWADGEVYGYQIYRPDGSASIDDALSGMYGYGYAVDQAKNGLKEAMKSEARRERECAAICRT